MDTRYELGKFKLHHLGPDCTVHGRRGWLTSSCFKKCMCGDILCALLQKYHYSSNACASSAAQCMHVQCLQCSPMHACAVPPVQHNACMCSATSAAQCMHVQCLQCSPMHACAVPPVQHNIVLNWKINYICM